MAEQRQSLLKSSISIKSIGNSVTNFSKGLQRSNVLASDIAKGTRQNNLFNERLISKENEFFRKRRENVRRKDREDELEASSVGGVKKREGNIITKSTKGLLGRILDFFGIILIGLFVERLPKIIKAIGNVINLIKKAVGFLTGFVDGVKTFLIEIGDGIRAALDVLPKFDYLQFRNESQKTLDETENRMKKINQDFFFGFKDFTKDVDTSMQDPDVDPSTGLIDYGDDIEGQMASGDPNVLRDELESTQTNEESGQELNKDNNENTNKSDDDTLVSGISVEEQNLIKEQDAEEQKNIATLKKIDEQSNKLSKIYENFGNSKITKGINQNMEGFGPSGSVPTGFEAGAFTLDEEVEKKNRKNLQNNMGEEGGEGGDDGFSMGTPQPGDFYMTVGGQGNKQKFYYVLLPNGRIKGLGKNRKPDGGRKFSKNAIVAASNEIKMSNIKGKSKEQKELKITGIIVEGESLLIDPSMKKEYNLDMLFNKNKPTIIFKDVDLGLPRLNLKTPSFSTGLNFDTSVYTNKSDIKKIHSLILDY